ncbi:hypothetical protein [Aporhodopirellula aestuarii]|uniref:hypothetical protein n=1 Tax=Aporhodopirellula aestuarii TaxID=2950107 RepID=UPI0020345F52|nr:hypothetical protein [Aporhodopirellula aestuarii]
MSLPIERPIGGAKSGGCESALINVTPWHGCVTKRSLKAIQKAGTAFAIIFSKVLGATHLTEVGFAKSPAIWGPLTKSTITTSIAAYCVDDISGLF